MKKEQKLVLIEELKNLNKLYKENKINIKEAEKRFDDFYKKKYRDSYFRISDMKDKLNIFLCDYVPFLYGIKNIEIIKYVNEKCKFIKIDYEKIGGKLYID